MRVALTFRSPKRAVPYADALRAVGLEPVLFQPESGTTSLDGLDISDDVRQRLRDGGINDVETIDQTDPPRLAAALGTSFDANQLKRMARDLLATPPRPPAPRGSTKGGT